MLLLLLKAVNRYILIGGYPWKAKDGGKGFAKEMVKDFAEPVKLLVCAFARPRKLWDQLFEEDKVFFSRFLPSTKIVFQLAQPDTFTKQLGWADAIYVKGGDNSQLKKLLNKSKGWRQLLKGKTLAGSSAGANIFAKYYYSPTELKLGQGFGLLPIKVLVHYKSDYNAPHVKWDEAYKQLKSYKEDLPLITLKEGQFKIIQKP